MSSPTFDRNRNIMSNRYNRGNDNKHVAGVSSPVSVGLYTIDNAILKYLQTRIKPVITQDGKQIQIPVIYGNPERWKSAQQDGNIRDKNGKILLPIIMIKRTNMKRNQIASPVNKYQQYTFKMGWNSRNIYDRFAAHPGIIPRQISHTTVLRDYYHFT